MYIHTFIWGGFQYAESEEKSQPWTFIEQSAINMIYIIECKQAQAQSPKKTKFEVCTLNHDQEN
jgi:hypothetical protein